MYLSNFKHNKKSMLSIILEGHATSHEMEGHTTLPTCVYLLELKWKGLFQNFLEVFWGFRKVSQLRGGWPPQFRSFAKLESFAKSTSQLLVVNNARISKSPPSFNTSVWVFRGFEFQSCLITGGLLNKSSHFSKFCGRVCNFSKILPVNDKILNVFSAKTIHTFC